MNQITAANINSSEKIERWEEFQELSASVVSIVASEFPKSVGIDTNEFLKSYPPISENDIFKCNETIKKRRKLWADLVYDIIFEIGNQSLSNLTRDANLVADPAKGWESDFKIAFERTTAKVAADKGIEFSWTVENTLKSNDATHKDKSSVFDPKAYVTFWNLKSDSYELNSKIHKTLELVIRKRLEDQQIPIDSKSLDQLISYLLTGYVYTDLRTSIDNSPDWLRSDDGLLASHPDEMSVLEKLTQNAFNENCRESSSYEWKIVQNIRNRHIEREDRISTLKGTIEYLVDAGILLKKNGNETVRYTLSPGMVAPLMSTKSSQSGESGFKILSKLRNSGGEVFKELSKEAASILFTSATIGIGKLMMGG